MVLDVGEVTRELRRSRRMSDLTAP
jgi:hypothetical protein